MTQADRSDEDMAPSPGETATYESRPPALSRRAFLALLGGVAVAGGVAACTPTTPPLEKLARLLSLQAEEMSWLSELAAREQWQLCNGLETAAAGSVPPHVIQLAFKIIAPRSSLFAFVDYPRVADERSICDGLIQE
jgi:hypothetical protein